MVRFLSSQRFLAVYSGVVTAAFAATVLMGARTAAKSVEFDRIRVHRIDVVEPDGTERLAISNKDAFPGSYLHGKEIARPDRRDSAGLLMVNDEGTEDGGMIWGGLRDKEGKPTSFGHLSFDQYDQDQTLSLGSALLPNGERVASLSLSDAPSRLLTEKDYADGLRIKAMPHGPERQAAYAELQRTYPALVPRATLTRSPDGTVGLLLNDAKGQTRVQLVVKEDGQPALEFLDAQGKVLRTISGAEGK